MFVKYLADVNSLFVAFLQKKSTLLYFLYTYNLLLCRIPIVYFENQGGFYKVIVTSYSFNHIYSNVELKTKTNVILLKREIWHMKGIIKDKDSLVLSASVADEDKAVSQQTTQASNSTSKNARGKSKDNKLKINGKAWLQYKYWLIGLLVSFIPLLAIPFAQKSVGTDVDFFAAIFKNAEIIFIGISLSISALNTYIKPISQTKRDSWIWLNMIAIIVGALSYGIIVTQEESTKNLDWDFLGDFNFGFFVFIFLIGSYKYILDIFNFKDFKNIVNLIGGLRKNG